MSRDYEVYFNPDSGSLGLQRPYDGSRHYDEWESFKICNDKITVWQYPDGQFIRLEMTEPGAGLKVDSWPVFKEKK